MKLEYKSSWLKFIQPEIGQDALNIANYDVRNLMIETIRTASSSDFCVAKYSIIGEC